MQHLLVRTVHVSQYRRDRNDERYKIFILTLSTTIRSVQSRTMSKNHVYLVNHCLNVFEVLLLEVFGQSTYSEGWLEFASLWCAFYLHDRHGTLLGSGISPLFRRATIPKVRYSKSLLRPPSTRSELWRGVLGQAPRLGFRVSFWFRLVLGY